PGHRHPPPACPVGRAGDGGDVVGGGIADGVGHVQCGVEGDRDDHVAAQLAPCLPGGVRVGPFGLLCVAMHNGFEDLDLNRLRRRRSEKWRLHPPGVLPAFIAEMDYNLAEPVLAALRAATDLSDCGYAALDGIGETFAAFA